jgi:hypothetical protein
MGVTALIIALAIMIFIDTTRCGAVSRALPVLWGTIAVVFIASGVVVRNKARKVISDESGRLAVGVLYGVVMLASYIFIAFVLMVAFNC